MNYFHESVLLEEVIHYLKPRPNQNFIDCTLGGGGHTLPVLKRILPKGKILGIDLDPLSIEAAKNKAGSLESNLILVRDNFKNLKSITDVYKFHKVNGILLDLGISSAQLQDQQRGFSFLAEGDLDLRFSPDLKLTASEIINTWDNKKIYEIFKNFGEEKLARPISQRIIEIRQKKPITSPKELVGIISDIYKKYYRGKSRINPATKIFQALRIAVNEELQNLEQVLPQAVKLLAKKGRLVVISYHSLEDRIVKNFFRQESRDCICPPSIPTCQCNHQKTLKIITKKPIIPTDEEITRNPRSRSAKLRVAERI